MSVLRCVALVAVLAALAAGSNVETKTSPMYSLSGLANQIQWPYNVAWRLVPNADSAGGDLVNVRLYWKAGQYAAFGFSPAVMGGYITAVHVPQMDPAQAVTVDVIGHTYGGISRNPNQYSRLLWAKVQDAGFVEAEVEVPVSAINITSANYSHTRMIFATSTWNSTTGLPEPHNEYNKMPVHVDLAGGRVLPQSLPLATAASHILQATSDFTVWWYVVYNTTAETSYTIFNLAISNIQKYAGLQFHNIDGFDTVGFACYFGGSQAVCNDYINEQPASKAFSKLTYSSVQNGIAYLSVAVPVPAVVPGAKPWHKTLFGSGDWNTQSNQPAGPPTKSIERYVIFGDNFLMVNEPLNPFKLFDRYYASWMVYQNMQGFNQYNLRAYLEVDGDYYVGMGFANTSMKGAIVACHMPQADALGVVCRDFLGHEAGGVSPNPVQSTHTVAAFAIGNGLYQVIVDVDLAKFNVSAEAAMQPDTFQRMIFAYGHWNATFPGPTYHGYNATYFQVNIISGAVNGTGPATLPPVTEVDEKKAAEIKHRLHKF